MKVKEDLIIVYNYHYQKLAHKVWEEHIDSMCTLLSGEASGAV